MGPKMRIISSNIRFASSTDGLNSWENRKKFLTELFNNFDADIIASQEGKKDQLYELSDLLPNLQLVDQHRDWIPERMYPCIYFNKKKLSYLSSGDIWLSKTPSEPGSKSFNSPFSSALYMVQI